MLRRLSSCKYQYFLINTSISIKIIFQYIHIRVIHYFNNDNIYLLYRDRYEFLKTLDFYIEFNPDKKPEPTSPYDVWYSSSILKIFIRVLHFVINISISIKIVYLNTPYGHALGPEVPVRHLRVSVGFGSAAKRAFYLYGGYFLPFSAKRIFGKWPSSQWTMVANNCNILSMIS